MKMYPGRVAAQLCCTALLACALAFGISACGLRDPSFHSTVVTGVDFGRDFVLTDTEGKSRALADFRGKAVMIFFGFTQCPAVCPTALLNAAEVRRALGADAQRVQVLFITLDPERDTPEVLRQYVKAFDSDFIGLSADIAGTKKVAQDFRVFFQKVPTGDSYTIDHSALTYVYDPLGKLRLVVRHDQSVEETAADLRALLS